MKGKGARTWHRLLRRGKKSFLLKLTNTCNITVSEKRQLCSRIFLDARECILILLNVTLVDRRGRNGRLGTRKIRYIAM